MDQLLRFNEDENNYNKYRPTYPDELFHDMIAYSSLNAYSNTIEIGIGTGQATKPILEIGCSVTAIELGDRLSNFVKHKYQPYSNFKVINANFMNVVLEENTFDLVYCATAFHWLPVKEGYRMILNILKPQGAIALFWNHPFPNRKNDPSNMASKSVYKKFCPSDKEYSEFSESDCKKRICELEKNGFTDIECKLYRRTRTLSTDSYINLLNTYSDHRALDLTIKGDFEKEMRTAIDRVGGKINIYDTIDLYLARKPQ